MCDLVNTPSTVAGVTGAGKSSLVNAIFGAGMAAVGVGQPVTQHFSRFAPTDMPVVVYDSKGLEQGKDQEFVRGTLTSHFYNG